MNINDCSSSDLLLSYYAPFSCENRIIIAHFHHSVSDINVFIHFICERQEYNSSSSSSKKWNQT